MKRTLYILVLLFVGFSVSAGIPKYLKEYKKEYKKNPKAANLQWFKEARFGMFIHYGLYSRLGRGEWVQLRDTIPAGCRVRNV